MLQSALLRDIQSLVLKIFSYLLLCNLGCSLPLEATWWMIFMALASHPSAVH